MGAEEGKTKRNVGRRVVLRGEVRAVPRGEGGPAEGGGGPAEEEGRSPHPKHTHQHTHQHTTKPHTHQTTKPQTTKPHKPSTHTPTSFFFLSRVFVFLSRVSVFDSVPIADFYCVPFVFFLFIPSCFFVPQPNGTQPKLGLFFLNDEG